MALLKDLWPCGWFRESEKSIFLAAFWRFVVCTVDCGIRLPFLGSSMWFKKLILHRELPDFQSDFQSNLEHLGEMRDWFDELMAVNQVPDHTIKCSSALLVAFYGERMRSPRTQLNAPESPQVQDLNSTQFHSFNYVWIESIGLIFRFHTPSDRFPLLSSCHFSI